jgi:hypothetical protein
MSRHLILSAAALALALAAPSAHAAIIEFPAANSRSFIELFEIDSGRSLCNLTCSLVASPTASVSQAPFSLVGGPGNLNFVNATGDISGTAMHSIVSGNIGVEYDLGFTDTYTVHGGSGPFAITVHLAADAIASSLQSGPFQVIAGAGMAVTIGTFSVDPNVVFQPSVIPFDRTTTVGSSGVISQGGVRPPFSLPLTAATSYTRIVNPGDVFDIGYELTSSFAQASIDASHTATIDFDLPDGVFLTGASGAVFGDVPAVAGVPEPASWALMIAGFGLAGGMLRKRRAWARA